mgnify:FL=1
MNYFQDIPTEVITSIAKGLDMKSLCNLIMSTKEFKSLCDTNDIWKYHYMVTIQNKWKITDDSVHIGGQNRWTKDKYLYKFNDGFSTFMIESYQAPESYRIQSTDRTMWDFRKNVEFIKELGCDPYICSAYNYLPYDILNLRSSYVICHGCMRSQMVEITNAGFVYDKPVDMDGDEYRADIYTKWKEYNESKGISNVCQDPTHYDMDTLEIPSSCRNFKNYKKVVVKKLLTKSKKDKTVEIYDRRIKETKDRIHDFKEYIKEKEADISSYSECAEKGRQKINRLKEAIDCM